MKKIIIGLIFFGFANHMNAQFDVGLHGIHLEPVEIKIINLDYAKKVIDKNAALGVVNLQKEVANFDLIASELYDEERNIFPLKFEYKHGKIYATFNEDGIILRSFEKFKNIALPFAVRRTVKELYPNWSLRKTSYEVTYYLDEDVERTYYVQIIKEKQKKVLRLDTSGRLL
ncbi:hypothetical protein [Mangrovimonas sp. YM274]|uniref:hypothetical protein n=1 Tax=Mangrovimonas sp. YM274 TaxID=3070660 RepID=UPI0027DBF5B6|nr:hypothetical protein [Mangrovimonas sp. YM274]WMI69393.1 hypothetical protein RBH95_03255 [Mangrovimonas sp. YM274]